MTLLYRLLLRLYPEEQQIVFGSEMLQVFEEAAAESRAEGYSAYASFLVAECFGLIAGAFRERAFGLRLTPIAGGIAVAAIVNYLFYSGMFHLVAATGRRMPAARLPETDPLAEPITACILGMTALLSLLPLFVILGMRVRTRRP